MLEYIRHLEELQIVSMIRENSGLYSFDGHACMHVSLYSLGPSVSRALLGIYCIT